MKSSPVTDATDVDSGSDDGTWTAVQRQKRKVSLLGLPELHAALANNAGTASSLQCAVSFHEAFSYRTLAMASVYVQVRLLAAAASATICVGRL